MRKTKVLLREEKIEIEVSISSAEKPYISDRTSFKWQKAITTLARVFDAPAGLIMQITDNSMKVFQKSNTQNNPYPPNGQDTLGHGLYCETVIGRNSTLYVEDSLKDPNWQDNPDVSLDMVSYLGMPLRWPDGEVFGTVCILDTKAVKNAEEYVDLLNDYKEMIESDLERELYMDHMKSSAAIREKEMSHRIKNHISIISQLIQISAMDYVSSSDIIALVTSKLQTLAALHDQLLSADHRIDIDDYLKSIASHTIAVMEGVALLEYNIEGSFTSENQILLDLGIITNELITNSIKYGNPNKRKDFVISICLENTDASENYLLTIRDNGIGFSDSYLKTRKPHGSGMGSILIKSVAEQYRGKFEQYNENGAVNRLYFNT